MTSGTWPVKPGHVPDITYHVSDVTGHIHDIKWAKIMMSGKAGHVPDISYQVLDYMMQYS